jgi:hypothetical protein
LEQAGRVKAISMHSFRNVENIGMLTGSIKPGNMVGTRR